MTRFLLLLVTVASVLFASCSPVRTVTPVAKETEASLQEEFQGTWKMGEGIFHVAFDDGNVGHFSWIEWKENDFVMSRGKFNALRAEDDDEMGYISFQVEDESEEGVYLLGAFKIIEPDSIVFWQAEPFDHYASLLEEEKLEGSVENADSPSKRVVFADGAQLAGKIDGFSEYFELEEPFLMTRVIHESEDE